MMTEEQKMKEALAHPYAYKVGREDGKEETIEKACNLYEEALCRAKRTGIHGIPQMVNTFRQAMEK